MKMDDFGVPPFQEISIIYTLKLLEWDSFILRFSQNRPEIAQSEPQLVARNAEKSNASKCTKIPKTQTQAFYWTYKA